jgi:hypothetical protein
MANVEGKDIQDIFKTPCILEVDIECPKELFEDHKDYPLAPEKYLVSKNQEQLCQTLYDKKNYVVHYENLKYYIQKGLRVTKVQSNKILRRSISKDIY